MIGKLDNYLAFNEKSLKLRGIRQEVLAGNIANADTPNFKARDFDFASALSGAQKAQTDLAMKVTNRRHLEPRTLPAGMPELGYRTEVQPSIDGNTVDMDVERGAFTDNAIRYQATLTFLQRRFEGLRAALQN